MRFALDRTLFCLYLTIIIVLEIGKSINNQPVLNFARNLCFAACTFAINPVVTRVSAFFLIALDATETISWFYTKAGFNTQALMAIDIGWITNHHREFLWLFLLLLAALLVLVAAPFPQRPVPIRPWYAVFFALTALVLAFNILDSFEDTFDPFAAGRDMQSLERRMHNATDLMLRFLMSPISVDRVKRPPKPNLIILELESLEYELLGFYNNEHPQMLPFLSKYVRQGTYFRNVISQPYTTWSVSSMFAVQCNLPLLMNHMRPGFQGRFHLSKNLRCLGDYLDMAGYHLYSYQSHVFVGQFKKHLKMHKYHVYDSKNHQIKRDWDLFEKLGHEILPKLAKSPPFILHVANADCHAFPRYIADERCTTRLKSAPPIVRSFDCVDQILENFVRVFENSSVFNQTDLVLYGDHVLMEGSYRDLKLHEPRSLVVAFPYHEQNEVTKAVSLYDIAPTVMDLLGVEYDPKFPFGTNLFSGAVGRVPAVDDFQTLYDLFTSEMRWDRNATCRGGQQGFCTEAKS
jgi:phosphoglycerol transferase MdoB-like AlkP superfamily enzyme